MTVYVGTYCGIQRARVEASPSCSFTHCEAGQGCCGDVALRDEVGGHGEGGDLGCPPLLLRGGQDPSAAFRGHITATSSSAGAAEGEEHVRQDKREKSSRL